MKKTLLLFIPLLLYVSLGKAQEKRTLLEFSGDVQADITRLLSNASYEVDIMDGIKSQSRQTELTFKLQQEIMKNYEWFTEYMKTVPKGQPMPYHPKLGLTKEEYEEFLKLVKNVEVMSTDTETLIITKLDSLVTFKGKGKLKPLDDVKLDLKNNKIMYKDYVLPFAKELIIKDANNGFKSKWRGYNWTYEYPSDPENLDISNLQNINITIVEFTVGQLENGGRIYIKLEERVVKNGVKIKDTKIPILF
ncbi:hypothetical protein [uncultured Kordia sp.]|uniref:hypothetical protein n=1 Tax=uncultured Kordia sp. TaxID=507699 RepID=UPI0026165212|nr:hypothetical protein [uncultured Kordia sp.]